MNYTENRNFYLLCPKAQFYCKRMLKEYYAKRSYNMNASYEEITWKKSKRLTNCKHNPDT